SKMNSDFTTPGCWAIDAQPLTARAHSSRANLGKTSNNEHRTLNSERGAAPGIVRRSVCDVRCSLFKWLFIRGGMGREMIIAAAHFKDRAAEFVSNKLHVGRLAGGLGSFGDSIGI